MGYSNQFNVKVQGLATVNKKVNACSNEHWKSLSDKFCSSCGEELKEKEVVEEIDNMDVIFEFIRSSDDARHLLHEDGSSCESGTGRNITSDLIEFSLKYPLVVFRFDVTWDSGFGTPPTRYYIKNGLTQECKAKMTFEDYNEDKLTKI